MRFGSLLAVAARPWFIAAAAFGAIVVAFPAGSYDEEGYGSAGPAVWVSREAPPHLRAVHWQWIRERLGWDAPIWPVSVAGRWGISWTDRRGRERVSILPPRPPGPADVAILSTSLWWLLGAPAVGSAVAVWRWVRGNAERDAAPSSLPWRLARPSVWAFAPLGLALLASGGQGWSWGPTNGRGAWGSADLFVQRDLPGARPRRAVAVAATQYVSVVPPREPRTGDGWAVAACGVSAERSPGSVVHVSDAPRAVLTDWNFTVNVWWLVGLAAAGSAVTLFRTARRPRGVSPAG